MSRVTPSPSASGHISVAAPHTSLTIEPTADAVVEAALQKGEVSFDSPTSSSTSSLHSSIGHRLLKMPSSKVVPMTTKLGRRTDSATDKSPLLPHKEINTTSSFLPAEASNGLISPHTSAKSMKFGSFSAFGSMPLAPPIKLRHGSLGTAFEAPNLTPGAGVAFSPSGDYLIRYGYGHELILLKASTGQELEQLTTTVGTNVRHAAFSLDGAYVVAAVDDGSCHVWCVAAPTDHEYWNTVTSDNLDPLCRVALSHDGRTVLSCDDDGDIKCWDIKSGAECAGFHSDQHEPQHQHHAELVAYVRDGKALLSCSQDRAEVMLLEAHSGRVLSKHMIDEFSESRNRIIYVISTDGSKLVIYLLDQVLSGQINVVVFDVESCTYWPLIANAGGVTHAEICADGSVMTTCGRDNRIQVWSTSDNALITTLEGHGADVLYCRVSADCTTAMSGDSNGCVLVWDLRRGVTSMRLQAHNNPVVFCDLSKDGTRACSVDSLGHAYLWHLDVRHLFDVLRQQSDHICCCEIFAMPTLRASASLARLDEGVSTNGTEQPGGGAGAATALAIGYTDGTLQLWDVGSAQPLWSHTLHDSPVHRMCLTADGQRLVSAGWNGRLLVTRVATGAVCASMHQHTEVVTALYRPKDGSLLISTSRDGRVILWLADVGASADGSGGGGLSDGPLTSPPPLLQLCTEDSAEIMAATAAPGGRLVAVACRSGRAFVWSLPETGGVWSLLHEIHVTDVPATAVAFSNKGKHLAIGSSDGSTTVYDALSGDVRASLVANASPICSVYFEEDAGGSGDAVGAAAAGGDRSVAGGKANAKTNAFSRGLELPWMESAGKVYVVTVCSRQAVKWDLASGTKVRAADFISDLEGTFFNAALPNHTFVANDGIAFFDCKLSAAVYDSAPREDGASSHLGNSYMLRNSTALLSISLGAARGGSSGTDGSHPATDISHPLVIYARPDVTAHMVATEAAGIRCLDFSSDGHLIVTGSSRSDLVVWDVAHRYQLHKWAAHKRAAITCVKFSHDGEAVYSGGEDGKVILWDWRTHTPLTRLDGHLAPVTHVDMSLDGHVLVSSDRSGCTNIWDAHEHGPPLLSLQNHEGPILSCTVSPDGSLVASSGLDEHVYIHDTETGALVTCLDDALDGCGLSLKFSFDGTRLQIGGEHGDLLIWDVHSNCMQFHIEAHEGKVFDSAWSGDSRVSLSVGSDGRARAWDSASGCWLCEANFEHGFGVFETGGVIKGDLSVNGDIMAGCTAKGHLVIWDIAAELRKLPDGSLLYEWLASMTVGRAQETYRKILASFPHIVNKQDGQGWTILMHAAHHRNPEIVSIITSNMAPDCECLGLVSSALQNSVGQSTKSIAADEAAHGISSGRSMFQAAGTSVWNWLTGSHGDDSSTAMQVSRYAAGVEPNALKIALAVGSADCVQHLLDAVLLGKISNGSYRALSEALRVMLEYYPSMCQAFLSHLSLKPLGQIEIPVELTQDVIVRASTSYTSYREMWETEFALHEAGPGPKSLMLASMVCLPNMADAGTDSFLHALVESKTAINVFGCDSVKAIIDYKWTKFARRQIYAKTVWYAVFAIVFSIYAILFTHDYPQDSYNEWVADATGMLCFVLGAVSIIFAACYLCLEVYQLLKLGPWNYFTNVWNFIDLVSYISLLIVVPGHFSRWQIQQGQALPPIMSLNVILLWVKMLFFGLAIEGFGTFIYMTFEILKGIRYFLVFMVVLLVAFAISFMVLFRTRFLEDDVSNLAASNGTDPSSGGGQRRLLQDLTNLTGVATVADVSAALDYKFNEIVTPAIDGLSSSVSDQYQTFQTSLLQMYLVVFGNTDPHIFLDSDYPNYATALMCVFIFLIIILLLNMLIALMSDIHNKVQSKQHFVFLRGRAELIVEVESTMSTKEIQAQRATPPFLHVLKSKLHMEQDGGGGGHGGEEGGAGMALTRPREPGALNAETIAKIADLVMERLQSCKGGASLSAQVEHSLAAVRKQDSTDAVVRL